MQEKEVSRKRRRQFEASQILSLLKRHLVDGAKVSDLCEEFDISPNQFYRWQKDLFEYGAPAFQRRGKRKNNVQVRKLEERNAALEAKLVQKDSVIVELLEDHVRLKKSLGED